MKINNILVPTDFSDCSINALKYALRLALDMDAQVTVINAYEIPIPASDINYTFDPSIYEQYEEDVKEKFLLLVQEIPQLKQAKVNYKVKMAFAIDAIVNEIDDLHIDLVVMGTKGTKNIAENLLGSNTYHVAKKSGCPVMAIPKNLAMGGVNNIAVAVDLDSHIDGSTFNLLLSFAKFYNAKIHFLHVSDSPSNISFDKAWEVLAYKEEFKEIENHFHFIENKDIEDGINQYIKNHLIDFLVVMPERHNIFARLFKPSTTKKLMLHAQIPLLTI